MPEVVVGADRDERDGGACGVEERRRRRRRTPMVGDLEHVEAGEAGGDELGIDALLRVPREEEPAPGRSAEQHDRDVVDAGPRRRGRCRDRARARPQDLERDVAEAETGAGCECPVRRPDHQCGLEGCGAGAAPVHPRLIDMPDAISLEDSDQTGDVVFVRVRQDHHVDPPVPRRDHRVELGDDAVGIGAAVDEHASAVAALDQDRVALADVEHDHAVGTADGVHGAHE